jgi:hypothetical protein
MSRNAICFLPALLCPFRSTLLSTPVISLPVSSSPSRSLSKRISNRPLVWEWKMAERNARAIFYSLSVVCLDIIGTSTQSNEDTLELFE